MYSKKNQYNSKDYNKIKKWAVTVVAALFLLILYRIIFGFSGQDAETSGGLSFSLSAKCIEFVNVFINKNWSEKVMYDMALYFEHPLRKFAHFVEYACMGILVYVMWRPWMERNRKLYLLVTVWIFASASFDEIHQYFVPGRYSSFADVLLDTSGGMTGITVLAFSEILFLKIIDKKRTSHVNTAD